MGSTIFVIDSSPAVRRMVEQISTPEGYQVVGFPDGPSALDAARKSCPALILADFHLENMTFSGFCKEIGRQDNLAETLIVSIVDASDRLDENKLRALGVRAFLKKPFHSEQLLDTINGILKTPAGKRDGKTPVNPRTWPPVSTATDDEDEQPALTSARNEASYQQIEKEPTAMPPLPSPAPPSLSNAVPPMTESDTMMKGLFDHFLQLVSLQADRKFTDLLPAAISKEVTGQVGSAVRAAVQTEVTRQLAEALAPERLQIAMRDLIAEELRRQTTTHLAGVETTIRQAVSELAPAILEESAEKRLRDLADSGIKKHLPDALRAQLEMIDQLLKKEIAQVAANCARQAADEIVHEMAMNPIQQAVQRIVPEVADTQIRAEIKRLSSAG